MWSCPPCRGKCAAAPHVVVSPPFPAASAALPVRREGLRRCRGDQPFAGNRSFWRQPDVRPHRPAQQSRRVVSKSALVGLRNTLSAVLDGYDPPRPAWLRYGAGDARHITQKLRLGGMRTGLDSAAANTIACVPNATPQVLLGANCVTAVSVHGRGGPRADVLTMT